MKTTLRIAMLISLVDDKDEHIYDYNAIVMKVAKSYMCYWTSSWYRNSFVERILFYPFHVVDLKCKHSKPAIDTFALSKLQIEDFK